MVEICLLVGGVPLMGTCLICSDRLANYMAGLSAAGSSRAWRDGGIGSEYSHPGGAEYPTRPTSAKISPQRQARILAAEPNRQGMAACTAFACNTFGIRTYKKMGVGVASPSPWEN